MKITCSCSRPRGAVLPARNPQKSCKISNFSFQIFENHKFFIPNHEKSLKIINSSQVSFTLTQRAAEELDSSPAAQGHSIFSGSEVSSPIPNHLTFCGRIIRLFCCSRRYHDVLLLQQGTLNQGNPGKKNTIKVSKLGKIGFFIQNHEKSLKIINSSFKIIENYQFFIQNHEKSLKNH